MSLDLSGCDKAVVAGEIAIAVGTDHPLIKLANALPWPLLIGIVLSDLKRTTNGMWWTGRKILIRIHLAAYVLQKIYDLTDRQMEYAIKDNAAYQLFCGKGIVTCWRAPDHTKIATFRAKLSQETQRALANETAKVAVVLGFADPTETDFDSTVQEANIAYPSDASLMTKLTGMAKKVIDFLKAKRSHIVPVDIGVSMKIVKEKARAYFFMSKNSAMEKRRAVFKDLHRMVKQQLRPISVICAALEPTQLASMPWNIRRAAAQIKDHAWRYLLDVGHFTRTHAIKAGKILAFHAQSVACIRKGKPGKDNEFGRVFQLGRIKGNFLFVPACTSLRMDDKRSLVGLLDEHAALFGQGRLKSASTDKGYWSAKNNREMGMRGVQENGMQYPANTKGRLENSNLASQERLRNRRAGIEPLIGHAKQGGQLGRSRMKSDQATLAAGYGSVLGFNLRQLVNRQRTGQRKMA